MEVNFLGHKLSSLQESIVYNAVDSALDFLMSKRLKKTMIIDIHIVKDLIYKNMVWGDVAPEDEDRSPKIFELRLNYSGIKSFEKLMETLSHELVHLTQFATRRLYYFSDGDTARFDGQRYSLDDTKYNDRPWEIEAFWLEYQVFDRIMEENKNIAKYIEKKSQKGWGYSAESELFSTKSDYVGVA